MITISLLKQLDSDFLTRRHGEMLVPAIQSNLQLGDEVKLDFSGVQTALPSFFNAVLGAPYSFPIERLGEHIRCVNANDLQNSAWRTAIENVLAFAHNPEERDARRRAAAEALIES